MLVTSWAAVSTARLGSLDSGISGRPTSSVDADELGITRMSASPSYCLVAVVT
jgi:hypothetical protein